VSCVGHLNPHVHVSPCPSMMEVIAIEHPETCNDLIAHSRSKINLRMKRSRNLKETTRSCQGYMLMLGNISSGSVKLGGKFIY
jgi:hypothetical protein